jgi:hypothetical protein
MPKSIDPIRESYINNQILPLGQKLDDGTTVIDRRSNFVVCSDSSGNETRLFLNEAYQRKTDKMENSKFGGFEPINTPEEIVSMFESIDEKHYYSRLHALKAVDQLFESSDPEEIQSSAKRAIKYLDRMGLVEQHHFYINDFVINEGKTVKSIIDLKHKASQSGIDYDILKKVYDRGVDSYDPTKTTKKPHDVGMERVQSFIKKAKEHLKEEAVKEEKTDYDKELDHLEKNPDEIDHLVSKINDLEDIAHHYSPEEFHLKLEEHLSREERIRRKISFIKSEPKRERSKELSLKRLSSPAKIKQKARKAAVDLIKEKLAKKPLDKLSVSEKDRLEDIIAKRKDLITRLAAKLAPKIRKIEQKRIEGSKHLKEDAGPKGERSSSADKEEEVIDVNGHEVVVSHSPQAVVDDGGVANKNYVSR